MMKQFVNDVKKFLKEEDGPTAIEYAFMASLIIVACILTIGTVGSNTKALFETTATALP